MPANYWFNVLFVAVISIGLGLATGVLRKRKRMQAFPSDVSGWLQILPDHTRRERLCASIVMFCTSGVPLLLLSAYAAWHYAGGGAVRSFTMLAIAVAAAEVFWVILGFRAYSKSPDDANVALETAPLRRDEELQLNIEVPVHGQLPTEIVARIVCIEHAVFHVGRYTQMSRRVLKEESVHIAVARNLTRYAAGTGRIRLPAESCPASGHGKSLNQHYEWQLRVEHPGAKGQCSVFPIEVV
jgi:hypothetical protein